MYIKEYMNTNVITVNSDTLIQDAEKIMRDNEIRRLPVVDKGKLVGLITRDRIRETTVTPATSLSVWELNYLIAKMKVKHIMESNIITVPPDMTIEEGVAIAQEHGIGTLPVMEKKHLVGIITTTDLYKVTIQVLGFGQAGVRLHIFGRSDAESMREVTHIISERGVRILSMFCVTPPNIGREDCIVHLDTEDASQIMKELREKGYELEARPH